MMREGCQMTTTTEEICLSEHWKNAVFAELYGTFKDIGV